MPGTWTLSPKRILTSLTYIAKCATNHSLRFSTGSEFSRTMEIYAPRTPVKRRRRQKGKGGSSGSREGDWRRLHHGCRRGWTPLRRRAVPGAGHSRTYGYRLTDVSGRSTNRQRSTDIPTVLLIIIIITTIIILILILIIICIFVKRHKV